MVNKDTTTSLARVSVVVGVFERTETLELRPSKFVFSVGVTLIRSRVFPLAESDDRC